MGDFLTTVNVRGAQSKLPRTLLEDDPVGKCRLQLSCNFSGIVWTGIIDNDDFVFKTTICCQIL